MKKTKKGELKAEKNEVRAGNYFLKNEESTGYMKITDVSESVTYRIHTLTTKGSQYKLLYEMIKGGGRYGERAREAFKTIAFCDHYALTVVLSPERMPRFVEMLTDEVKAHPELYGGTKAELTDKEQEDALKSVRLMEQMKEKAMEIAEE